MKKVGRTMIGACLTGVALFPVCGCDALLGLVEPQTTVRLVNDSDFAVEGELFYDDEDDTIEEILEENGTRRQFAIAAGGEWCLRM